MIEDPEPAHLARRPGVAMPDRVRDGQVDQCGQDRPRAAEPARRSQAAATWAAATWAAGAAFVTGLPAVRPVVPEASVARLTIARLAVVRPVAWWLVVLQPLFFRPIGGPSLARLTLREAVPSGGAVCG